MQFDGQGKNVSRVPGPLADYDGDGVGQCPGSPLETVVLSPHENEHEGRVEAVLVRDECLNVTPHADLVLLLVLDATVSQDQVDILGVQGEGVLLQLVSRAGLRHPAPETQSQNTPTSIASLNLLLLLNLGQFE